MDFTETFKEEIAMISDASIRNFVIEVMTKEFPEYIHHAPCSSTGKYHPKWNQGVGGIARHIKVTAFYGAELTRAIPLGREETMRSGLGESLYKDVVVAACLLHDGWKHGRAYTGDLSSIPEHNTMTHGVDFAKHIYNTILVPHVKSGQDIPFKLRAVLRGIAGHMGRWTDPSQQQYWPQFQKDSVLHKVAMCVHIADYISSRRPTESIQNILTITEGV